MINCIIVCATIIFCWIYFLTWIRDMSKNKLPMFTWGVCELVESKSATQVQPRIDFVVPEEKEEEEDKPTDKQIREALISDPITLASALIRGDLDYDEISGQ